jgi:histidinol-phosphate aminotransferase
MSNPVPRPGIMDITPYVGGESTVPGITRIIKLASNEGALGPSPKAVTAYRRTAEEIHRYPDGGCTELRETLANHYGLEAGQMVCGAGSDELISLLCRAYAGVGDEVLYSQHGFLMYPIAAKTVGATPVAAPEADLTTDVDALLAAVTQKTRILFLANPNNPTGTYLPAPELKRLRNGLPEHIPLIIDAAYAEFVTRNDYTPGIDMVEAGDNVVMTRTFSKIHALGGVRLGWAYCPPAIADVLNRLRNPFNVCAPAQAAGLAALADVAFTDRSRAHNDIWLPWFTQRLRELGLTVPPSLGNFVLARFPTEPGRDAESADVFLKNRGIIARRMAGYGLPDSLRITIGLEDEMRAVVDAVAEFLG